MYKKSNRPGRVYMYPTGSTEVDLGEFSCARQVVLKLTRESLQVIKIGEAYNRPYSNTCD